MATRVRWALCSAVTKVDCKKRSSWQIFCVFRGVKFGKVESSEYAENSWHADFIQQASPTRLPVSCLRTVTGFSYASFSLGFRELMTTPPRNVLPYRVCQVLRKDSVAPINAVRNTGIRLYCQGSDVSRGTAHSVPTKTGNQALIPHRLTHGLSFS